MRVSVGLLVSSSAEEDGYNYLIKSNSWSDGGLSFKTATLSFTGRCTVQKIDRATGVVVSSLDNYLFTVDITDGNIREADTFAFKIWAILTGSIYRQIGTAASLLTLGGGNVIVQCK